MRFMNVLITGATGFIGSHLTERLVKEGYKVSVLVKKESNRKERKETLNILKNIGVKIFLGDLLDVNSLIKACKNKDVVFHLAAIARPMAIPKEKYFKVNVEGTKNLLEACRKNKVKKIIHMSSISVVGPTRDGNPVNEKTKPDPIDTYGESKLAAEKVVFEYIKKYNMNITILRPPMVFGPRDFEMLRLFKAISKGFFPLKEGKGYIEFLYVENLVDVCILAMKKGKKGEIYHINNGESYRMSDVVKTIAKAENVKLKPIKFPNWSLVLAGVFMELLGKIFGFHPPFSRNTVIWMTKSFWYTECTKAKKELGYQPKINLEEGIKRTVEYYKKRELL